MFKAGVLSAAIFTACLVAPLEAGTATLTAEAEAAVMEALNDEYHAQAFYSALVDKYGANTPFNNIVAAEETHADRLIALLTKYGVEVPENGYLDGTLPLASLPATLDQAYEDGVAAEIANIALYEQTLLPAVAGYNDVTRVFTSLKNASERNHLPTFEKCSSGGCQTAAATGGQADKRKLSQRKALGTGAEKASDTRNGKPKGQAKRMGQAKRNGKAKGRS